MMATIQRYDLDDGVIVPCSNGKFAEFVDFYAYASQVAREVAKEFVMARHPGTDLRAKGYNECAVVVELILAKVLEAYPVTKE